MSKRSASKAGLRDEKQPKKAKIADAADYRIADAYMPTELFENILAHADGSAKAALFATCTRVYNLKNSQNLALATLKKHAEKQIRTVGLDYDYAHEASLAGWIIDNYTAVIEEHNEEGLELPTYQDFATCFSNNSEYSEWDKFKKLLLKCHLFADNINGMFGAVCYRDLLPLYPTPQYQTLSRMAPYHKYLISGQKYQMSNPLIPLHHPGVRNMLVPRSLNTLELQLFNIYNTESPDKPLAPEKIPQRASPLIRDEKEFKKALNKKFKYDTWAKLIEWDNFFMVGGSVLNCLLQNEFKAKNQDMDFFFSGDDYSDFTNFLEKFEKNLTKIATGKVKYGENDSQYVKTFSANVKRKKLQFQFIWYDDDMDPNIILHIFDLDACQVGWNGEEVLGTPSFVQSLTTSTMINYKLVNNGEVLNFLPRTIKYLQRGFTLLTPKQFDMNIIAKGKVGEEKKQDIKCEYTGFLLNNDSMQVCKQFVELVTGVPQLDDASSAYSGNEEEESE